MRIFLSLFSMLLLPASLHAQEKKGGVTLRFLSGIASASLNDAQLRTPEWQGDVFRIPFNQLSQPQAAETRALRLFRMGDGPEPVAVCDVILPEEGNDFIVILVPGKESPRAVILNGKAPNFRPGDVFIHNASDNAIALALGTTRAALKPGQGKSFTPGAPDDADTYEVAFLYDENGTAKRLALTQWPLNDRLRGYVFFLPGENNRPIYRAVQEFVPRG